MMQDAETSVEQLKQLVKKFSEERDWSKYHNAKDLSIGIVTEASELLQQFRFKSQKEVESLFNSPYSKERIYEEIADIFYFLLRLSERYNIDLSSELRKKLEKNAKKYPVSKFKGSNKKYDEL
jgi:NTP pyrophosphatase (non-canonical NTP hydrolase)